MTLRVEFPNRGGTLGAILTAVGEAGGMVGAVDIVRMQAERSVRDITVNARDSEHGRKIVEVVEAMPKTHVANISDRTFL
ncbi:MAG TPA: NAD-dependent malic enzyme, partial [Rubrobacteraceae bacterium]|nr:NAD-dependent malic enzyme [Rubrobacteraceae bacterium]